MGLMKHTARIEAPKRKNHLFNTLTDARRAETI